RPLPDAQRGGGHEDALVHRAGRHPRAASPDPAREGAMTDTEATLRILAFAGIALFFVVRALASGLRRAQAAAGPRARPAPRARPHLTAAAVAPPPPHLLQAAEEERPRPA